jgi:DNA-binding transcriptional regulator YiaG
MAALDKGTRRALKRLAETGSLRASLPDPSDRRQIRASAGVSAAELAAALHVSRSSVYDWEANRRRPSPGLREQYSAALQILREAVDRRAASKKWTS